MEIAVERPVRPEGPGNLQAWARDVRYAAAARLAEARDATIVTGHTADDQVETILYRLASSPSRRALLGMKERDGRLARPLLGTTRAEVTAYDEARGLPGARTPPTRSEGYARNRVRHGLLPELEAIHPAAVANVLRTAALLRDEAEVLDGLVAAELDGSARLAARPDRSRPASRRSRRPCAASSCSASPMPPPAARSPAPPASPTRSRASPAAARGSTSATASAPCSRAACCGPSATYDRRPAAHPSRLRPVDDPAIGATLVSSEELQKRIAELGAAISRDYAGKDLVMVGVLKGAVLFLADLMRHIDVPCEIDFMAVSSYGSQTDSSGVVRILKDLDNSIQGRDVLIVEDIIDSGLTLQYLMRNLGARDPASLEVCSLLTKPERLRVDLPARYVGFEIPNEFAIGYGLDHAQRYRNLDYVAALVQ